MNILYSFPFSYGSVIGKLKVDALRSLGHDVYLFDDRKPRNPALQKLPAQLRDKLKRVFLPLNFADIRAMNRELVEYVDEISPDLLIVDKGNTIHLDTIRAIRSRGVITANWFPDNLNHWPWMKKAAATYNYFFHFDSAVVQLLCAAGFPNCYHIPFGCCSKLHRIVSVDKKDDFAEVCFVGAYSSDREELLSNLCNYGLKIFGYKQWSKSSLRKFYCGVMTNDDALVELYNRSKIVVNKHYEYTGSGANVRTFEVLGCGAFQLVDNQKDIVSMFKDGEDLVMYKDGNDLKQKVGYYLKNKNERKRIALNGYDKVHRLYTYKDSLKKMMDIISEGQA